MKAVASLLVMLFLLLVIGQFTNLVKANPGPAVSYPENPDMNEPTIDVETPENGKISNVDYITLSFSVQKPLSWTSIYPIHGDLSLISYILDGRKVDVASGSLDLDHANSKPLIFTKVMTGLSEGNHSLQVYVRSVSYYLDPNRPDNSTYGWWNYPPANYYMDTYSAPIPFIVDTTFPSISILSVENKMFESGDVPFSFAVDEPARKISYCLDNCDNVTISGNTTLAGLSTGLHTLIVYVTDEAGNTGASEAVQFTTTHKTEPLPSELFPVMPVVAVSALAVVVVVAGLLVYYKNHNRRNLLIHWLRNLTLLSKQKL